MTNLLLASEKTNIAVLDFESAGISETDARVLTNRLRTLLASYPQYQLIERGRMELILKEQQFQLSGCTSDECVVEVGQLLGVERMLTGAFGLVGSTYTIDMRIIDVSRGSVVAIAQSNLKGKIDDVLEVGLQNTLDKLLETKTTLASLKVTTVPSGAEISLNGVIKGKSPLSVKNLRASVPISVRADLGDYAPDVREIILEAGENRILEINLQKLQGSLNISGVPTKARLKIDGNQIGISPLPDYRLDIGDYQFAVSKPGYFSHNENISVKADQQVNLNFALKPIPKKNAFKRSLIFPGMGQFYQKYPLKGFLFTSAGLVLAYLTIESQVEYADQKDVWIAKRDTYNHNITHPELWPQQLDELKAAFNQLQYTEKRRNIFVGGLGAVWTLNLIDIAL